MPYEPISNFIFPDDKRSIPDFETQTDTSTETLIVEKDFDKWNSLKKNIQSSDPEIICNEREVWWCSLGLNIGHEQDGKNEMFERPMLIIRKFSKSDCLCVPFTTSSKKNPFHVAVPSFNTNVSAIVSQVKLISTKRFLRKIDNPVGRKDFRRVKEALHKIINWVNRKHRFRRCFRRCFRSASLCWVAFVERNTYRLISVPRSVFPFR